MQSSKSKYQSKVPEKSVLKLKENGARELSEVDDLNEHPYVSMHPSRKGFSIPADIQLTLKPDTTKGAKPSLCLCKPPAKRKFSNENINQREDPGFQSEIRTRELSCVEENVQNGARSQEDYAQFYLDILLKESSRASVIQYASCLSSDKQKLDTQIHGDEQLNSNQIRGSKKQISNRESERICMLEQTYVTGTENNQIGDRLISDELKDGKEIGETQQHRDETRRDDGKIPEHISQQKVADDKQLGRSESQDQSPPAKHSSLCGVCLREFSSVLSLERHQKENGHYLCSLCGETLRDETAYWMHLEEKLCKKAVCTFCAQKFITRSELESHKAVVHHKCLECNKLYNSAEKLLAHNERYHSAPYTCLQCGEEFPTRSLCKEHATTKHKKKKYFCPECGRDFTRLNLLNRHATYTHSDARNFKCEICFKTFKRPDALKIHMITHSDNKPFHCEECGKDFNQKICYTKHLPCKKRKIKTKGKKAVPQTMVEKPISRADHLDKLSDTDLSEIFESVSPANTKSDVTTNPEILDKMAEKSFTEIFENVSSARLAKTIKEKSVNPNTEEIYMGCRCPPTCRCKKFSVGLKMQAEEIKGPLLDSSEEIASLSCCCDTGLDIYISD